LDLDYKSTLEMIKMLTDLRFKLLAFVPTVSAFAVSFLGTSADNSVALGIGVLGFAVTLGIVLYDLRNSQIYNLSMHRAKWLEYLLDMPRLTTLDWQRPGQEHYHGGLITERPFRLPRLFRMRSLTAKHDRALALIYGASLGGWAYLIANSLASLVASSLKDLAADRPLQLAISAGSLVLAFLTAILFAGELNRLDNLGKEKGDKSKQAQLEKAAKAESERINDMPPRPIEELEEMKLWYNRPQPDTPEPPADDTP
jgi:hypothetical protein